MKALTFILVLISISILFSCNQGTSNKEDIATTQSPIEKKGNFESELKDASANGSQDATSFKTLQRTDNQEEKNSPQEQKTDEPDKKKQQPVSPAPKVDWDKKILKTAAVNLEVADYQKYYLSIRERVKSLGGYVAQEEQSQSDYKIENSMVVKVPVDQFDNALLTLTTGVVKINERKISSMDVTAEVVDTKSRIEAKKQVRQRYMGLLNQAKNMEEILNVQSEINQVQEEIESATGRVDYLSHSAAFSTINLTYYQVLNPAAIAPINEKEQSFGQRVKGALASGWDIVSNFFIIIITIWPLILGSFFVYFLYKRMSTHKPKQA